MKIKAFGAGTFYPAEKTEFEKFIRECNLPEPKYYTRAVIVPHAGYKYSGKLCANGIKRLKRDAENVFIFSPSHYERIFGCVSTSCEAFQTPLGDSKVNSELSKKVSGLCDCVVNNFVFENEHSIGVLLPLIKYFLPEAKVIPIIYGCENFTNLTETIEHFFDDDKNVFVISSDLSHFYPERDASKIDDYTAKMIEENDTANFEVDMACGAVGICGLVNFAKNRKYSLIRIGMMNSSAITGDSSRVVGYGGWFLFEGEKNQYIKNYYSNFVKTLIRGAIQAETYNITEYDCVFEQSGASFVTIELDGILRGCAGSVNSSQPLIKNLYENAFKCAYLDDRFPSLTEKEFEKIDIKVSLLTKPERILFDSENELEEKLRPYAQGVFIRDGFHKAVFLPEVWLHLPDRKKFMEELKQKAGLGKDYFSETIEVFGFYTTVI